MEEQSRRLRFKETEIGVVYYRAGYAPTDFTTDAHWAARLKVILKALLLRHYY